MVFTCHHNTGDTANTLCTSRGTTACSGHTATSAWTSLPSSHSSSTAARYWRGDYGPMTAHQAAKQVIMHFPPWDTSSSDNHNPNHVHNLHHKVTCPSQPADQEALLGGCTSCECSLSSLPCSPCPCQACFLGSVYIPNELLVWCSLSIYGAAIQRHAQFTTQTHH